MKKAICCRCQNEFNLTDDGEIQEFCPDCTAKIDAMRKQMTELTEKNEKVFNFFPKITDRISRVLDVAAQKTRRDKKELIALLILASIAVLAVIGYAGTIGVNAAYKQFRRWVIDYRIENFHDHETAEFRQCQNEIIADLENMQETLEKTVAAISGRPKGSYEVLYKTMKSFSTDHTEKYAKAMQKLFNENNCPGKLCKRHYEQAEHLAKLDKAIVEEFYVIKVFEDSRIHASGCLGSFEEFTPCRVSREELERFIALTSMQKSALELLKLYTWESKQNCEK